MKKTYRQNRETGKLVEVVRRTSNDRHHFVHDSFSEFVSPIDGSHITTAGQLTAHNKKHGVSNDLDHLREQSTKRPRQETSAERKSDIRDTLERMQSSGFHLKQRDM